MPFNSPQEEIEYWKLLAEEHKQAHQDVRNEFTEFQASSQELEAEMEVQLDFAEKKVKEYQTINERLQNELDSVKERFEDQHRSSMKQITEQQDELAQLRAYKEELEKYIRELEQMNDDLERAKRETVTSLQDFESKLNQAIERNAFLESELDDKDYLMESVQRLKDEARDLRQELDVRKVKKEDDLPLASSSSSAVVKIKPEGRVEPVSPAVPLAVLPAQPEERRLEEPSTPTRPLGLKFPVPVSATVSPSARISALNIVSDLLRKVGALESKLNAVKNHVKEQSPMLARNPVNGKLREGLFSSLELGAAVTKCDQVHGVVQQHPLSKGSSRSPSSSPLFGKKLGNKVASPKDTRYCKK